MAELYQRLYYWAEQAEKNKVNSVLKDYHQGCYDTLVHVLVMLEDKIRMDAERTRTEILGLRHDVAGPIRA